MEQRQNYGYRQEWMEKAANDGNKKCCRLIDYIKLNLVLVSLSFLHLFSHFSWALATWFLRIFSILCFCWPSAFSAPFVLVNFIYLSIFLHPHGIPFFPPSWSVKNFDSLFWFIFSVSCYYNCSKSACWNRFFNCLYKRAHKSPNRIE